MNSSPDTPIVHSWATAVCERDKADLSAATQYTGVSQFHVPIEISKEAYPATRAALKQTKKEQRREMSDSFAALDLFKVPQKMKSIAYVSDKVQPHAKTPSRKKKKHFYKPLTINAYV